MQEEEQILLQEVHPLSQEKKFLRLTGKIFLVTKQNVTGRIPLVTKGV